MTFFTSSRIIIKMKEGEHVSKKKNAFAKLIVSMVIFGSIGIFVRNISLASSAVAMVRAVVGTVFLFAVSIAKKKRFSVDSIKKHVPVLLFSGAALGFNWILLFESYKFTSVAVSTLCYYTAPIIVIFLSPLLLKERLTGRKLFCVIPAVLGMVFVSGILTSSMGESDWKGILLGLGAAVLYATVVILNKMQADIPAFDRTVFQLGTAAIVLIPYNFAVSAFPQNLPDHMTLLLLLAVGVIHTGLAYYLYFSSMEHLEGQTMAIISYVDPVIAIAVSVFLLREKTSWQDILGAVLILGAAVLSELPAKRKERACD